MKTLTLSLMSILLIGGFTSQALATELDQINKSTCETLFYGAPDSYSSAETPSDIQDFLAEIDDVPNANSWAGWAYRNRTNKDRYLARSVPAGETARQLMGAVRCMRFMAPLVSPGHEAAFNRLQDRVQEQHDAYRAYSMFLSQAATYMNIHNQQYGVSDAERGLGAAFCKVLDDEVPVRFRHDDTWTEKRQKANRQLKCKFAR